MRKRVLTTLLLVAMSCTMLTGCFKKVEGEVSAPSDFEIDTNSTESKGVAETPAPTVAPTPEPTVAPTPEPTVAPKQSGVVELSFANNELDFVYGYGGVVITKLNDLYGATDYDGNVIVENKYPYYYQAACEDGYFILGDDSNAYVFDKSGQLVYTVASPRDIKVNENIVCYAEPVGDSDYAFRFYDLEKKALIEIADNGFLTTNHALYTSACVDGKIYIRIHEGVNVIDIVNNECKDITDHTAVEGLLDTMYGLSYSSTPIDGYGAVTGGNLGGSLNKVYTESGELESWVSPHVLGLLNTEPQQGTDFEGWYIDRNEKKLIDIDELSNYLGLTWNKYNLMHYMENGVKYHNKEQLVALWISDGTTTKYCLLDFSKAVLDKLSLVTNIEDVVVFTGDYVCLSDSDYFLAAEGEDYFYIDASGNKVADYDDCADFMNGYAAIKEDGMVYIVDTSFNKVSEGYPADVVYKIGDFFGISNGGQITYVRFAD